MRIFRFFATSVVATAVDFLAYISLISFFSPAPSNFISASLGLVVNFFLQKRFVFNPRNSLVKSFTLSTFFSVLGLGLGTGLIYILTTFTVLSAYPVAAKVVTTGVIFFYNYLTKKIAFAHKENGAHPVC